MPRCGICTLVFIMMIVPMLVGLQLTAGRGGLAGGRR
jgi:hypothetical protein